MKKISVEEVRYLAHALVKEIMDYGEPIPEFETRFPNKLEVCLEQPFQQFEGHEQYPSLEEKAATLFYSIIKNHPFVNGNKRMAVAVLLVWLYKNNFWTEVSNESLYETALVVAESKPEERDRILKNLHIIFRETIYKKNHKGAGWFK